MQNPMRKIFLLGFFYLPIVFAFPKEFKFDPTTPIQIQSNTATFDQMHRQAIHEGDVIMTQGNYEVRADKIIAKKETSGRLTIIYAIGNPASFKGKLNDDPHPVFATAKKIYYYPDEERLVLEGKATLDHQQDKFRGPLLSYQIDKQLVTASKHNDERPVIIIHPQANKK